MAAIEAFTVYCSCRWFLPSISSSYLLFMPCSAEAGCLLLLLFIFFYSVSGQWFAFENPLNHRYIYALNIFCSESCLWQLISSWYSCSYLLVSVKKFTLCTHVHIGCLGSGFWHLIAIWYPCSYWQWKLIAFLHDCSYKLFKQVTLVNIDFSGSGLLWLNSSWYFIFTVQAGYSCSYLLFRKWSVAADCVLVLVAGGWHPLHHLRAPRLHSHRQRNLFSKESNDNKSRRHGDAPYALRVIVTCDDGT